jgi:hypothetical protein
MDLLGNSKSNRSRQQPAAELPQWNARFRFTAQKGLPADNSKDVHEAAKASQQVSSDCTTADVIARIGIDL